MPWGGLNPALTSWRNGIVRRFPARGTQSDGGYADAVHGSTSQHQADKDGTVDAFDCDVNFEGSTIPTGNGVERRICEALKADFEDDRRAQLWIHQREIANKDVRDWAERDYSGPSPHDHHIHFESDPAYERDGRPWAMPRTDALLRELNGDDAMATVETTTALTSDDNRSWTGRRINAASANPDPTAAVVWMFTYYLAFDARKAAQAAQEAAEKAAAAANAAGASATYAAQVMSELAHDPRDGGPSDAQRSLRTALGLDPTA